MGPMLARENLPSTRRPCLDRMDGQDCSIGTHMIGYVCRLRLQADKQRRSDDDNDDGDDDDDDDDDDDGADHVYDDGGDADDDDDGTDHVDDDADDDDDGADHVDEVDPISPVPLLTRVTQ